MENKETVFNTEIDKLIDSMDLTTVLVYEEGTSAGPGKGKGAGTAAESLHSDFWMSEV